MERDPQAHWLETETALYYAQAAVRVGLWASERLLIARYLPKSARLLELGCGGGRVALGLRQAGYHDVTATDFSPIMVSLARAVLADHDEAWEHGVEQQDATSLTYPDASFDHTIFAFNGLMCLPSRTHRREALRSIHRVLRPGGILLCSSADREKGAYAAYLAKETAPDDELIPGDRWHETETSPVFMHSSTEPETRQELFESGFSVIECPLSTEIADDGPLVREFAGETRFYVAKKA